MFKLFRTRTLVRVDLPAPRLPNGEAEATKRGVALALETLESGLRTAQSTRASAKKLAAILENTEPCLAVAKK